MRKFLLLAGSLAVASLTGCSLTGSGPEIDAPAQWTRTETVPVKISWYKPPVICGSDNTGGCDGPVAFEITSASCDGCELQIPHAFPIDASSGEITLTAVAAKPGSVDITVELQSGTGEHQTVETSATVE